MNIARKKIAEIARQNKATIVERDKTIGMIDDMREKLAYDVYLVIRQAAQSYYDHQFNKADLALMTWETVAQEIESNTQH